MEESKLIKCIKYNIIYLWQNGNVDVWHIDDILAMSATIIYPFRNKFSPAKDEDLIKRIGTLCPIHKALVAFLKKQKKYPHNELNYESLQAYLKDKWISKLDIKKKKEFAAGISLIANVEDNGYVSLKGNEKVYNNIIEQGPEMTDITYGNQVYEPTLEKVQTIEVEATEKETTDNSKNKKNTPPPPQEKAQPNSNELTALDIFWKKHFCNDTYSEAMPFVWKLCISKKIYLELKKLLKEELEKTSLSKRKFLTRHAEKLLVYVAEWYHWEYNGSREKNSSVFSDISYNWSAKDIWDYCNKKYAEKGYIYSSAERTLWQYSIYVLGGFPLMYCSEDNRFDRLFKEIFSLQDDNSEINDKTTAEIVKYFDSNNSTYFQSLKNGSWNAYIFKILEGNLSIAAEDENDELVKKFKELIENGKRESYESFFKSDWLFYTDSQLSDCSYKFRIKIGYKKDKCYIPYNAIPKSKEYSEFLIGLEAGNCKSSSTIRFSQSRGGETPFVGWGTSCMLSIEAEPNASSEIKVMLYRIDDTERKNGIPIHVFSTEMYFHLFATGNPYEWSTETDNKAQSALLYFPKKYMLDNNKVDTYVKKFGDDSWNWIYLQENATLTEIETGNEVEILIQKGHLVIELKNDFDNTIQWANSQKKQVLYRKTISDEIIEEYLPLLVEKSSINRIILYPFEKGEQTKRYTITDQAIQIEYKQERNSYIKWDKDKDKQPHFGKVQIRVSDGNHSTIVSCFYLPNKDIIKRDIEKNEIICNTKGYSVFAPNKECEYEELNPDNKGKYIYSDDNTYLPHKDVIPIRIGKEDDYIELNVYRARKCREIYLGNNLIKTYNDADEIVEIPVILHKNFEIRTIDENGVTRADSYKRRWFNHFFNLQGTLPRDNYFTEADSDIKFYLYTNRIKEEGGFVDIGKNGYDQYKFFYWKISKYSEPIQLKTEYNSATETLKVPLEHLEEVSGSIIFQSLKDCTPRHYLKPWYFGQTKYNNIDIQIKCFEIACEHQIYFSQFYPLRGLRDSADSADNMINFFKAYCTQKKKLEDSDYRNLHKLAHELLFDWILLPHASWKRTFSTTHKEQRHFVNKLFSTTPFVKSDSDRAYLKKIIDCYWTIKSTVSFRYQDSWGFNRSKTEANIFTQCMRDRRGNQGSDVKMYGEDYERSIKVLETIYATQNLCYHVYQFINEIKNQQEIITKQINR